MVIPCRLCSSYFQWAPLWPPYCRSCIDDALTAFEQFHWLRDIKAACEELMEKTDTEGLVKISRLLEEGKLEYD